MPEVSFSDFEVSLQANLHLAVVPKPADRKMQSLGASVLVIYHAKIILNTSVYVIFGYSH